MSSHAIDGDQPPAVPTGALPAAGEASAAPAGAAQDAARPDEAPVAGEAITGAETAGGAAAQAGSAAEAGGAAAAVVTGEAAAMTIVLDPESAADPGDPADLADLADLADPESAPDPADLADPELAPDPADLADPELAPDAADLADPELAPDPADLADPDGLADLADLADDAESGESDESGDPADPRTERVSKLAVLALVTGVLALVPIAVSCAVAALAGIRRSGRRGHGMAMGALFISAAWVIIAGAISTVGVLTHGFHKPVTVTYRESAVFKLRVGDCVNTPNGQVVSVLPCSAPHEAEVFATFTLPDSAWPGTVAVRDEASSGCASMLTGYINPQLAISLAQDYVFPDQVAWTAGTRTVICEVRATSGELTGSVRGAADS